MRSTAYPAGTDHRLSIDSFALGNKTLMRSHLRQLALNLTVFKANARERLRAFLLMRITWALHTLFMWHDRLSAGMPRPDRNARLQADRYSRTRLVKR